MLLPVTPFFISYADSMTRVRLGNAGFGRYSLRDLSDLRGRLVQGNSMQVSWVVLRF